jgi:hypothetical protein
MAMYSRSKRPKLRGRGWVRFRIGRSVQPVTLIADLDYHSIEHDVVGGSVGVELQVDFLCLAASRQSINST